MPTCSADECHLKLLHKYPFKAGTTTEFLLYKYRTLNFKATSINFILYMNIMNSLQGNNSNNVHESNITGFFNNNCNNLPQATTTTAIQANPSYNCNNNLSGMDDNNNMFPTETSILSDHNHSYHQSMPDNTLNNNVINSFPDNNNQQPILNDISNNNANNIHNFQQQFMSNNASTPHFNPQYINQNPPLSTVFPPLNSLGMIIINSPQTNIYITQQDNNHPSSNNTTNNFQP
jgi:hypothetical protein